MTESPRIAVTRHMPEPALELLRESGLVSVPPEDRPLDVDELYRVVAGAHAVVSMLHDRIDDDFLDAAGPQLRIVANVAVGYDNIDIRACARRGVVATNTPGVLTEATADLAFALLLAVTRRLGEAERLVRAGFEWSWSMFFMLGMGIQGKILGVIGLGQIGTAVASRARAFGMQVVYAGPRRVDGRVEASLDAAYVPLEQLLETADVVSLHCPLKEETRHLIDASALARMKPAAYLINTTRGPVVDEAALVDALRQGSIAGAGLDVYENEPEVHPGLLELENVVLLPHLGSATVETREAMALLAATNVVKVLRGEAPVTPIA